MCKEDFAVNEKGIMPGGYWEIAVRRAYYSVCGSIGCQKKALDKTWFVDIIIFTHFGRRYASQECQLGQARCASATAMLESTPGTGRRSPVSTERLLRCPRLGSGQVRDAASRPDRAKAGQASSRCVRVFSPQLLPGRVGFSEPGAGRVDSRKARAAESAQADDRSARVCATDPSQTALLGHDPTGDRDSRTLRHSRSSPQHRARSGAPGKKTTLNQEPVRDDGAALVAAYEELRRQALEEIRSEGWGLALLLEQGMAAWMKACSAAVVVSSGRCIPPVAPVAWGSALHGEVVRILVSMALGRAYARGYDDGSNEKGNRESS